MGLALTVVREGAEEQDRVPDKQNTLRPHCQGTKFKEDRISLL